MPGDHELGAAHVLLGGKTEPLAQGLRSAQRMTNTALNKMTADVEGFWGSFGKGVKAGLATAAAGIGTSVGTFVSQLEGLKFFAREVGRAGGDFRNALSNFDAIHKQLSKQVPLTRKAGLTMAAYGKQVGVADSELETFLKRSIGLATLADVPFEQGARMMAQARLGKDAGLAAAGVFLPPGALPKQIRTAARRAGMAGFGAAVEQAKMRPDIKLGAQVKDWFAAAGERFVETAIDVKRKIPSAIDDLKYRLFGEGTETKPLTPEEWRLLRTRPKGMSDEQFRKRRAKILHWMAKQPPPAGAGAKGLRKAGLRAWEWLGGKAEDAGEYFKWVTPQLQPSAMREGYDYVERQAARTAEAAASARESVTGLDEEQMKRRGGMTVPGLNTMNFDNELTQRMRELTEAVKENTEQRTLIDAAPGG